MQILVPMAGAGSRFRDAGYTLPKPLIDVDGRPMISRVIDNLGRNNDLTFTLGSVETDKNEAQNSDRKSEKVKEF